MLQIIAQAIIKEDEMAKKYEMATRRPGPTPHGRFSKVPDQAGQWIFITAINIHMINVLGWLRLGWLNIA